MSEEKVAKKGRTSNTNTPYDDVFKTLLLDCRKLIIPVVNEIFNEDYTGEAMVRFKENEIYLRNPDGEEEERITDSSFAIEEKKESKNYHLECQSTPDGSMMVRMYEYGSQIALKDGKLEEGVLHVNFPQSAVLYLRHTKNTPDVLKICINTPGGSVSYDVPAMKIKNYSVDSIFDRRLYFLIPFYIFVYSHELDSNKEIEPGSDFLIGIRETYTDIMERLEKCCEAGEIDEYTKCTICQMSEKVVNHLAVKHEHVKKEVCDIMGGTVLEYEAKSILKKGISQGKLQTILSLVKEGELSKENAARRLNVAIEQLEEMVRDFQE